MTSYSLARQSLATHSRSFAVAAHLLPPPVRDETAVVYAYCRRIDDAIDESPTPEQPGRLHSLRRELDAIYCGVPQQDPISAAMQRIAHDRRIPRAYPTALLDGMAMDVHGERYATLDELVLYCYRVAGTVGLMMCHVMGIREDAALRNATHLAIAMQLTNICRDVGEDWSRGRLYLPRDMLRARGADDLSHTDTHAVPEGARTAIRAVVADLLDTADAYYRSGEQGLDALSLRCGFAVRAAKLIYARIGRSLRARGCDALHGRVYVPPGTKAALVAQAGWQSLALLARRSRQASPPGVPRRLVEFTRDILLDTEGARG